MRIGDDAIEEAAVQLVHIGADDEQQVGAIAHLGERRHDPAARLHYAEVAILALAERMIEHAAGAVGDRQDGARTGDVAGHAAVKRELRPTDETRGGLHRLLETNLPAVNERLGRRQRALEPGSGTRAAVADLEG